MKYEVRKSSIHGQRLFATKEISNLELLGYFKWRFCKTDAERDGDNVITMSNGTALFMSCDLKYINHSDNPNVILSEDFSVCAIRDINIGEEILYRHGSKPRKQKNDQ